MVDIYRTDLVGYTATWCFGGGTTLHVTGSFCLKEDTKNRGCRGSLDGEAKSRPNQNPDAPWCWNIYLHNWVIFGVNVGKYSSTMVRIWETDGMLGCDPPLIKHCIQF